MPVRAHAARRRPVPLGSGGGLDHLRGAHTGVVVEAADRAEQGRRAHQRAVQRFQQAVERERDAIALHGHAAAFHEAIAAELYATALTVADSARADELRRRAAAERDLAGAATGRAVGVRARLAAEGVADDG